jgi:hypothetical protein
LVSLVPERKEIIATENGRDVINAFHCVVSCASSSRSKHKEPERQQQEQEIAVQ